MASMLTVYACQEMGIAATSLETLVDHTFSVSAEATLETVYHQFRRVSYEYAGVVDEADNFVGVVSKGRLGFLLGARFGFAVYARQSVRRHIMPHALRFIMGTALEAVLKTTMERKGDEFYDDVALLDQDGKFSGMISVRTLVRLQHELLEERTALAEGRQHALEQRNQDLRQSLDALRESRGRFDILFENSALGVALLTPEGKIAAANQQLWNLLPTLNTAQHPQYLTGWITQKDRHVFLDTILNLSQSGQRNQKAELEVGVDDPGQGQRRLLLFLSWIMETSQICLLADDVTDQRLLEKRLMLQEKSALMENLAGGVAHEINNKLAPIVGFTELIHRELEHTTAHPQLVRYCQMVHDSAVESAQIIRQLLQLSRPGPIERTTVNLKQTCAEALTMLGFRIRQLNCQVRWEFPRTELLVLAEAGQIKQVVMNLALNALDAMEKSGTPVLTLGASVEDNQVRLFVSDSGHGIAPEHLARIFDPFFTTKGPDRGTGLGLSVCDSIIRHHGSEIQVESLPGKGTTFSFKLPGAMLAAKTQITFAGPPVLDVIQTARQTRKVLLADDEEAVASLLRETLVNSLGYKVEWAVNGQEAIEQLKNNGFDLIISDVRMPLVDGLGVYRWVKENSPLLTKSFLFITGDAGSRELSDELERLGVPVLRKPFGIASLVEHCRELTRENPADGKQKH